MRFKNKHQLPVAGRTRAWHHHRSDTPTSPRAIYVLKSANGGLFYTPLYFNQLIGAMSLHRNQRLQMQGDKMSTKSAA